MMALAQPPYTVTTQAPIFAMPAGMGVPTQAMAEEAGEAIYSKATGYVGGWVRNLKLLCITTIIFCVFTFLFAGLTVYSNGETVEYGLDFESRSFVITPMIIPLVFIFFANVRQFATTRYNRAQNLDGQMVNEGNNGRRVTREVFSSLVYPSIISLVIFVCYITSFSLFFAYGTPRCATESLNENREWYYLLHKGACAVYNWGFLKLLLAGLIVTQTGLLMFYFYKSMPVDRRKQAGSLAEKMGGKAARAARAVPGAVVGASSAAAGVGSAAVGAGRRASGRATERARGAIREQATQRRQQRQQRQQQQQRVASSGVAQQLTTAANKKRAAERAKGMATRFKQQQQQQQRVASSGVAQRLTATANKRRAAERAKGMATRFKQQQPRPLSPRALQSAQNARRATPRPRPTVSPPSPVKLTRR